MNKQQAQKLSKQLRFSYFSSKLWLECLCEYKNLNGEDLALIKNHEGKYILQFAPQKNENLQNTKVQWATQSDIKRIEQNNYSIVKKEQVMFEYFYDTKEVIEMNGSKNRENRHKISYFEKHYLYKISHTYNIKKAKQFLKIWDKKQKIKTTPYERGLDFCYFVLDNLEKETSLKSIFVEVNNELVGFAIGEKINKQQWIGLHQKINYSYKGLGRWLFRERAKLFNDTKECALGGAMGDVGIQKYKESLNPIRVEPYFYIQTKN